MPNEKLTEIAVILDRSGSMAAIKDAMEEGFGSFTREQKNSTDPCVVSLYQFDHDFEVVFEEKPVAEVHGLNLKPRGGTALLDACFRSITLIGERLAKKSEEQRPGSVVVLIITDGHENASKEVTRSALAAQIKHQQEKYQWQFAFLGSNIDSFSEGSSLGIPTSAIRNFESNTKGVADMYSSLSRGVSGYRKARSAGGQSATSATLSFDEDEKP